MHLVRGERHYVSDRTAIELTAAIPFSRTAFAAQLPDTTGESKCA
jgi:hypothetical protein